MPIGCAAIFKPALILGLIGLLAVGLWRAALTSPDGRLHLDVFNLAGGPALLVRSPVGQAWLVNGGSESNTLADALGRRLPLFTTRLDGLLVTAGRPAVVLNALTTLTQRYTPAVCALSAQLNPTKTLARTLDHLLAEGVSCSSLNDTPSFDLGGGGALRVLVDGKQGTALWLEAGGFHVLIPGGAPPGEIPGQPFTGLSLLILSQKDLENMAPTLWADTFQPQAVLFTGGVPPLPGWIGLDGYDWVSFQTDGSRFWVEGAQKKN